MHTHSHKHHFPSPQKHTTFLLCQARHHLIILPVNTYPFRPSTTHTPFCSQTTTFLAMLRYHLLNYVNKHPFLLPSTLAHTHRPSLPCCEWHQRAPKRQPLCSAGCAWTQLNAPPARNAGEQRCT